MNTEELMEELEETSENLQKLDELHNDNKKLLEEIKNENSVRVVLKKLAELQEKNKDKERTYMYLNFMISVIENSLTLDVMSKLLSLTDKNKLVRLYKLEYKNEMKKLNKKLKRSRFDFVRSESIYESLLVNLSEDDAQLFMFSLCRIFNSKGILFINRSNLFISQLFKNIISSKYDDFPEKEEFIENLNRYINEIRED